MKKPTCQCITKKGKKCRRSPTKGQAYCYSHKICPVKTQVSEKELLDYEKAKKLAALISFATVLHKPSESSCEKLPYKEVVKKFKDAKLKSKTKRITKKAMCSEINKIKSN